MNTPSQLTVGMRKAIMNYRTLQTLLLAGIALTVVSIAYQGPYLIQFVDEQFPITYSHSLHSLFYAWNPVNLGTYSGINIYGLPTTLLYLPFELLSLPPWIAQFSVNALALFLSGYGMALLLRRLLAGPAAVSLTPAVLAGSVFYMLNIVVAEVIFWDFIPVGPLLQALLPFQVLLLIRGFDLSEAGEAFPWMLVGAISIISPFTIGANIPLAASAAFLLFGVMVWRLAKGGAGRLRPKILFALTSVAAIFLANCYWLVPEITLAGGIHPSVAIVSGFSGNLADYQQYTGRLSFVNVLLLQNFQQNLQTWYAPFFDGPSFYTLLMIPFLIILLSPLSLLDRLGSKTREESTLACWCMLLAVSWLSLGVNAPYSGQPAGSLFETPALLPIFRNTGNSFGLAIAFLESILFVSGVISVSEWVVKFALSANRSPRSERRKRVWRCQSSRTLGLGLAMVLAVICIAPAVAPAATGSLIPTSPYQARLAIPASVDSLASFINGHAGAAYTLLVPGGFQEQNLTNYGGHGYLGQDILESLIVTPLIDSPGGGLGGAANSMIQLAYSQIEIAPPGEANYSHLLTLLDVKYIVLESGLGQHYPWGITVHDNISQMESFLGTQTDIEHLATYGPYQLYENSQSLTASVLSPSVAQYHFGSVVNITQLYANATDVVTNAPITAPLLLQPNSSSLILTVNKSQQLIGLPSPGFPVTFNSIPLEADSAVYPYLTVNFSTNQFSEVMFEVSDATELNQSDITSALISTWQYSSPVSNGVPSEGWYYSYGRTTSVTINISSALSAYSSPDLNASSGRMNYLAILVFPTEGNATQQAHTTEANVHNLSVSISSISLSSSFYANPSEPLIIGTASPQSTDITSLYASAVNSPGSSLESPLSAEKTASGFNLTYNGTALAYPGYPIAFNSIPLEIDATSTSCLAITFQTNPGTAVAFGVSGASSITEANFNMSWTPAGGAAYPSEAKNLYTSPTVGTVGINAFRLLSQNQIQSHSHILNFIYIQIVGVSPGVTQYSVSITAIRVANYCSFVTGPILIPPPTTLYLEALPQSTANFDLQSDLLLQSPGITPGIAFASIGALQSSSPTSWSFDLNATSDTCYIVLLRNFDSGWQLSVSEPNVRIDHVEVDGFANGWILSSNPPIGLAHVTIVYTPQGYLSAGLAISATYFCFVAVVVLFLKRSVIRRKLRLGWNFGRRCITRRK